MSAWMVAVWTMVRAAKKKARRWGGCTIFIDEFDALGQSRGGAGGGMGGMGGMFGGFRLGLNMLLVQMDGMDNPGFMKKALRRFVNLTLDGLFVPQEIRVNGSFLNSGISLGYGALSLTAMLAALPALFIPIGVFFGVGALIFFLAPAKMPGLPAELSPRKLA